MYDFFNDTNTDHHDHDHGHDAPGSDVNSDDSNNSRSESTHDDDMRNHHKQEKESPDMNRIIKNSSTPILTGFALSMMFIFSSAFNTEAFDAVALNGGFNNVFATADLRVQDIASDRVDMSLNNDANVSLNSDGVFNANDLNFAGGDRNELVGSDNDNPLDADTTDFARSDLNPSNDDQEKLTDPDGKYPFGFDNASFISLDNNRFVDITDADVIDDYQAARADDNNIVGFDGYDLNSDDFVA